MSLRRRLPVVFGIAALSLVTVGTAFAVWTSQGAGTGSATAGTLSFRVTAVLASDETAAQGLPSSTLVPGGSATALLRITNGSSLPVHVVSISAEAPTTTGGCPASSVSFTSPAAFTDPQFTLAANSSETLSLASAVHMDAAAPQSCMGATFSFPVTVTVQT